MRVLYASLKRQSDKDFEWLIIDDGSTDNLSEDVKKWSEETKEFEIRYFYQKNGGKHRAWNNGVKKAKGDYIMVVDSDDYVIEQAVEMIKSWIAQIYDNRKCAGISGCKGYIRNGKCCMYGNFPSKKKYVDASNLNRHYPNLQGDKAEVYRTELLQKYVFPEFAGEKFCTEDVVFNQIARAGYFLRWFPDIIQICEYREDGLTKNVVNDVSKYKQGYICAVKNGAKYDQFPYNYVAMGRCIETLRKEGNTVCEVASEIQINVLQILLAVFWYSVMRVRRRFINWIGAKHGETR